MKKIIYAITLIFISCSISFAQESNDEKNNSAPTTMRSKNSKVVEFINTSGNITYEKTENPYLKIENQGANQHQVIITTERKRNPNFPEK